MLKYRRKVAKDHTIRLAGQVLHLPRARFAYAGKWSRSYDGERELAVRPAPRDPVQLRSQDVQCAAPGLTPAAAALPWIPPRDHPWRRVWKGTKLYGLRLTEPPDA